MCLTWWKQIREHTQNAINLSNKPLGVDSTENNRGLASQHILSNLLNSKNHYRGHNSKTLDSILNPIELSPHVISL